MFCHKLEVNGIRKKPGRRRGGERDQSENKFTFLRSTYFYHDSTYTSILLSNGDNTNYVVGTTINLQAPVINVPIPNLVITQFLIICQRMQPLMRR